MLEKVFLQVINMSYIGSIVILFVLAARMLLKKTPKKYSYILWAVALFRFIVPISFESILSLIPVNPTLISNDILYDTIPQINTGISNVDHSISGSAPAIDSMTSVNPMQVWINISSLIWIVGIVVFLIYGIIALIRIKRRLENASCEKGNIYKADSVDTPFVLGLIQPKIYLPASLSEFEKEYIVLHERTHIKRFDHVIRFISYIVLCIHWFNPLVWIAFWLSGKDMEMSCDESVINKLGHGVKKDYSQSLLNLATGRRNLGMTPLAFGEGETKGRIKNILNFKKPKFSIIIVSASILLVAVVGLLSNPKSEEPDLSLLKELRSYILENGRTVNAGPSDTWIQNPSRDPVEVVQSAIENQIDKDYTIAARFVAAEVDDAETQRQIDRYKGSELAEKRGWTDTYLTEHFIIVKASYYVEYDHTKTFMDDGNLEQYFYLTRDTDTGLWSIIDNSSPSS